MREKVFVLRLKLFTGLAAILFMVACDPCKNLAEKICECEKSSALRESCLRSLDMYSQMKGFDLAVKTDQCREILDSNTCTCSALNDGLVEKCGLTR